MHWRAVRISRVTLMAAADAAASIPVSVANVTKTLSFQSSWTRGAPGLRASSMSTTAGNSSNSNWTEAAMSSASARERPTHAATISPTNRTLQLQLDLIENGALDALVAETADNLRFHHAKSGQTKLRTYASFTYRAGSWTRPRKGVARLECSLQPDAGGTTSTGMRQEVDIRYVVTSLKGSAHHLYEKVYCQRGQMENLIKLHKAQLASDRMSCHSAIDNQVRLVFHTASYWLMHRVRAAIPPAQIPIPTSRRHGGAGPPHTVEEYVPSMKNLVRATVPHTGTLACGREVHRSGRRWPLRRVEVGEPHRRDALHPEQPCGRWLGILYHLPAAQFDS
jgi:hypothetical protein